MCSSRAGCPCACRRSSAHRVPQLAVPDLRRPAVAEEVVDFESVRLFVERARGRGRRLHPQRRERGGRGGDRRQARRPAAGDRARRASGADAHAPRAAAPSRPASAPADRRSAGRRRPPADTPRDDRVESRPPAGEGEDALRAARRLRRRLPPRGRRGGVRLRRHLRRRAARRARLTRPEEPPAPARRTPTASRASGCSRRSGSSALELLESAGELEEGAGGTQPGRQTRPSGWTPSRGPATTRPSSRGSTTSTRTCARRSRSHARRATASCCCGWRRRSGASGPPASTAPEGRRALEDALELSGRRPARTLLGLCTLRMLSGSSGNARGGRAGGARGLRGAGRRLQPRPGLEPRRARRGNRDGLAGHRRGGLEAGALVRAPRQLPGGAGGEHLLADGERGLRPAACGGGDRPLPRVPRARGRATRRSARRARSSAPCSRRCAATSSSARELLAEGQEHDRGSRASRSGPRSTRRRPISSSSSPARRGRRSRPCARATRRSRRAASAPTARRSRAFSPTRFSPRSEDEEAERFSRESEQRPFARRRRSRRCSGGRRARRSWRGAASSSRAEALARRGGPAGGADRSPDHPRRRALATSPRCSRWRAAATRRWRPCEDAARAVRAQGKPQRPRARSRTRGGPRLTLRPAATIFAPDGRSSPRNTSRSTSRSGTSTRATLPDDVIEALNAFSDDEMDEGRRARRRAHGRRGCSTGPDKISAVHCEPTRRAPACGRSSPSSSSRSPRVHALVEHPRLGELWPEYLVLQHQIIRATVPLTEAALARARELDGDPLAEPLARYLEEHVDEELGHDETLLGDLELLGFDRASRARADAVAAVAALVGSQYYWIHHYHPVAFLGYVALMEGYPPTPELIDELIERTRPPARGLPHLRRARRARPGPPRPSRPNDRLAAARRRRTRSALGISAIATARSGREVARGATARTVGTLRRRWPANE